MIRYTPSSQLTLEGFKHPFDQELDSNNRWVILSQLTPWDELAAIYSRNLRDDSGRLSVDIRMVIASLIVKHRLGLSDRDTVDEIAENIYIQFFCGLKSFQRGRPFDPSLFVDIRKRMGSEKFDAFNDTVISRIERLKPKRKRIVSDKQDDNEMDDAPDDGDQVSSNTCEKDDKQGNKKNGHIPATRNNGKLKIDATVADQQISYPTDHGLVNRSREESERIIDLLYELKRSRFDKKPRTYRRKARRQYLALAKKKNKTKKEIRKSIGQQLRYLKRNIKNIHFLLDMFEKEVFPLSYRDQKIFWVIQHIYVQQKTMYDMKAHSHPNRIVSIYQPYVRPIVRGKDKAAVEFGSKISLMECEGMSKVDHISWEAFNEAEDMQMQVEKFHKTFGCYPELLLADRIYLNRENRAWLKEKGIRIVGKPLGRPPKEQLSPYQQRKQKKERNQRNNVEGKIGQGKNGYGLNKIKARRRDTSESWISAIFFVMNLMHLMKVAGERFKDSLFFAFSYWVDTVKNTFQIFSDTIVCPYYCFGFQSNSAYFRINP